MITFDLACDAGHRFEGWFRDRGDFDDQLARGLLACPVCGSDRVTRQLSAVAVRTARRSAPDPAPRAGAPEPTPPKPEAFFRALSSFVETHFEDVGTRFAQEARAMEAGDSPERNIRGTTTSEEEEGLREDGIDFVKVPLPKYDA